jgi:lipopolysaccharide/colanic/teichoic acid biosynthesis glycosyltransferase
MKALIIATGYHPQMPPEGERHLPELLPLLGRPMIQHLVEVLVAQGIRKIDFILSLAPERLEELLGNGQRWGAEFRFHLARDPENPYRQLRALYGADEQEMLLLGHANRLPKVNFAGTRPPEESHEPVLYCEAGGEWTGWAWTETSMLGRGEAGGEAGALLLSGGEARHEVSDMLDVRSWAGFLEAHWQVLDGQFSNLFVQGQQGEPGVWLSRNVSLHPTARLISPVYIGDNCRIGRGVTLGPQAVVSANCVLDAHCTIENTAIFPGSYVGEGLELKDSIVDRNMLVNMRFGATVTVADDFILGSLAERSVGKAVQSILSRLMASFLLVLGLPLLVLTILILKLTRQGPVWTWREVVRLPASEDRYGWRTYKLWSLERRDQALLSGYQGGSVRFRGFFLRFLPALLSVVKGDLAFVGVPARSIEETMALPEDWRALYLQTKGGIVTEGDVVCNETSPPQEFYSAEAFYSVSSGIGHDLKLLLGYFKRIFI